MLILGAHAAIPFGFLAFANAAPGGLELSILIIFGSAKLLAELFERIGQPGIVGEILAGMLIGPSVLGWINPNEMTATLAELGIVFLLFHVGLEIETSELLQVKGIAALVAVAGVTVQCLAGWGIYRLWGKSNLESIFLGAALAATSVGVTAHVLSSKGLLSRTSSRIILAAAVIDDILALLVLGIASSLAQGTLNLVELTLTTLFSLAFIIVVIRWGNRTLRRIFTGVQGKLRLGEGPFAVTIVLLFGLAALSVQARVAAATGAFLAGAALGESLTERVRQQARGVTELFVPFFMAGIGLNFDWRIFANRSTLTLALVILVTAILSKVIACGLGASRYGLAVARRVGLGMIPRGEFSMVVAQIGLGLSAMTAETFGIVVFVAVVSTLLTAPLVKLSFHDELRGT